MYPHIHGALLTALLEKVLESDLVSKGYWVCARFNTQWNITLKQCCHFGLQGRTSRLLCLGK